MGFLHFGRKREDSKRKHGRGAGGAGSVNRWSDWGCESCLSWVNDGTTYENFRENPPENVIFLHGFLSSSSFWTRTVFPYFSGKVNQKYRLIAIDLLGFNRWG
ncbi:hypothetical protein JHK85_006141 [Glycine max]|nr:hypothetical protein JHK85_006141 [Glycine max]KAG5070771.1 hypothetical protein JHK86_005982 [Glycine max]